MRVSGHIQSWQTHPLVYLTVVHLYRGAAASVGVAASTHDDISISVASCTVQHACVPKWSTLSHAIGACRRNWRQEFNKPCHLMEATTHKDLVVFSKLGHTPAEVVDHRLALDLCGM